MTIQSSLTLAQATQFYNNPIVPGVAQTFNQVNPFLGALPIAPIGGNAVTVNMESQAGGVDYTPVNALTSTAAQANLQVNSVVYSIKRIEGLAAIDGLEQATSVAAGVDQMAIQVQAKAMNIARMHGKSMVNGSFANGINSLKSLTFAGQSLDGGNNTLSFSLLRELLDLVVAKDGHVDFLLMSKNGVRQLQALYDALGGTRPDYVFADPFTGEQRSILSFEGIPVFKAGFASDAEAADGTLPNETGYVAGTTTSIYAGTFDSGDRKSGLAMIVPSSVPAGIAVKQIGELENQDAEGTRITQYCELANFNSKALARAFDIKVV